MAKARRRGGGRRVSAAADRGAKRNRQKLLTYVMGFAAVVAVIAAIVVGINRSNDSAQAADFRVSLYQGAEEIGARELDFSRLEGRPVVLNFWAGLCPPCRAEMPQFQLFYEEFKDRITLLGVDIGPFTGLGSHEDADSLLRELGVTYPAGWTDDGSVPSKYGVAGMPTTVFITSGGEIFDRRVGAIDRNFLARATQALLAAEAASAGAS